MNIKRKNGKMVCIQKNNNKTYCGQDMGEDYIITEEPCLCKQCLRKFIPMFLKEYQRS